MNGLINQARNDATGVRHCLRGHGPMIPQPGTWVLQQVQRMGLLGSSDGNLRLTGQLITTNVFICQTCGNIELVNEGGV